MNKKLVLPMCKEKKGVYLEEYPQEKIFIDSIFHLYSTVILFV